MDAQLAHFLRDVVTAAAATGLKGITEVLSAATKAPAAIFDTAGNVLAVYPERSLIEFSTVLAALRSESQDSLWAERIEVEGEDLAILAVADSPEPLLGAAAIAAVQLELGRLRARVEGRRELAGQILDDVLSQRASEMEAVNRFTALGLDIEHPFRVLIHRSALESTNVNQGEINLQSAISGIDEQIIRVKRDEHTVVLMPDSPVVNLVAKSMLVIDASQVPLSSVGVSRAHIHASGLRAGYFEAMSAAQLGPGVHAPDRLSLSNLMVVMNTQVDLLAIANDYLSPLLGEDNRSVRDAHLLETLAVYLATGRSVTESAERLFIHRNTLRYRLTQLEELLGVSFDSTEDTTDLWLSLKIRSRAEAMKGSEQ